jgi:CheY-like chemotaxis protein
MISEKEIRDASILIVDDQEANIILLEELLRESGYQNTSSTMDPTSVFALHNDNQYDLILLDILMPVMDGFQVIEKLKTSITNDYLPILVLTAQPEQKLRALAAGAKDFVSKPFDLVEVKTRIRNILEVRLLYKKLLEHNQVLEKTVEKRTAELRESEGRYRSLIELAADWYWEQDANGAFTRVHGPVTEILKFNDIANDAAGVTGWNEAQRQQLHAMIVARQPFLDFVISRRNPDDSKQTFSVSGEPMFNLAAGFVGFRGIGVEIFEIDKASA